ncbi:hypothetical protein GIB67_005055 [Kingdonia uniflora]|uniref:Uncharacterized protein n=1 Tax=Kingdonia uniflora TaxID=39325 RepID=A0A7J7PBA7_9MAGN|nr:hypothetical protein GIB67_005055 [Kingdonia uniflora]
MIDRVATRLLGKDSSSFVLLQDNLLCNTMQIIPAPLRRHNDVVKPHHLVIILIGFLHFLICHPLIRRMDRDGSCIFERLDIIEAATNVYQINSCLWKHCTAKLSQIIHHNSWSAPSEVVELLAYVGIDLNGITLNSSDKDVRVWKHCPHGLFTLQSAFQHTSPHASKVWWYPLTNNKVFQPIIVSFAWRVCHNSLATEDLLIYRGFHIVSRCSLCKCNLESMQHLFWNCPRSIDIWVWIASLFQIQTGFSNLKPALESCHHLSSYLNDIWKAAILNIIYLLWRARNDSVFEGISFSTNEIKRRSLAAIKDQLIGSPGKAGIGAVARNHLGDVSGVLTIGLGNTTNFFSECEAIIGALDWAVQKNRKKVWIESDSHTAISDFSKNHVPWPQRARWNRTKTKLAHIRFSHCWKVANFSASQASKRGVLLPAGNLESFLGRPLFLTKLEEPNVCYFRFN